MFKYRYCKSKMVAFVNGELPAKARQRVGRYIDECPRCYDEYLRQRDLQRTLKSEMPSLGQPESGQLNQIWARIQMDMQPKPPMRFQMRYGLATVMLVLVLIVPMLLGQSQVSRAAVTQPTPQAEVRVATDTPYNVVAIATHIPDITLTVDADTAVMPVRTPESNE